MPGPKRIAFLTPHFVTAGDSSGGLSNYLDRMTRALVSAGHEPEVFVLSKRGPGVVHHGGVRTFLVNPVADRGTWKWAQLAARVPGGRLFRASAELLGGAAQLGRAFERRDAQRPFDFVQSSDYFATGHYVKARHGRPHLVRCSIARELFSRVDQADSPRTRRCWTRYELEQVREAEIAYAPSEFVADYYQARLGRRVHVVRPPALVQFPGSIPEREDLPERFLLHFGQLRPGKGTVWLLDALPVAWREEPEMRVVFAGPLRDSRLARRVFALTGDRRIVHFAQLSKADLYAVLRRAAASILPSLVDNLPNTVIESLCLGIPVIGSRGASIDELVVDGESGELVPLGNVAALGRAMVAAWRGELRAAKGFAWAGPVARVMTPGAAVQALGKIAGVDLGTGPSAWPERERLAASVELVQG